MQQLDLFTDAPAKHWKAEDGATWTAGAYACRNWRGFFQSRQGIKGSWEFQIDVFGDDEALIFAIADDGSLTTVSVPIDDDNRITVRGRKFGRDRWNH